MIKNYIKSLLFYFNNPSLVSEDLIKLKVKELVLLLANTRSSENLFSILGDLFNPEQYAFRDIINAHLFEDLSLDDLAHLTQVSLSTFKRRFRSVFKMSPTRYIIAKRLEKACDLLKSSGIRISDVAYDCGFNDPGYFSKCFISAYGKSPSLYRKELMS